MSSIALFTPTPARLIIKPDFMKLTDRIRAAMQEAGLTQAEVARQLGISPQAVNGWFRTNTVDKENVAKLAALTGRPLDYFYPASADPARPASAPASFYNAGISTDERTLLRVFRHLPAEARDLLLKSAFNLYLNEQPDAGSDPLAGSGAANLVTGPNEPHSDKRTPQSRRHKNP